MMNFLHLFSKKPSSYLLSALMCPKPVCELVPTGRPFLHLTKSEGLLCVFAGGGRIRPYVTSPLRRSILRRF